MMRIVTAGDRRVCSSMQLYVVQFHMHKDTSHHYLLYYYRRAVDFNAFLEQLSTCS